MKHYYDTSIVCHAEPAGNQISRYNHTADAQSWPLHSVPPMLAPSPSNPNLGEGNAHRNTMHSVTNQIHIQFKVMLPDLLNYYHLLMKSQYPVGRIPRPIQATFNAVCMSNVM